MQECADFIIWENHHYDHSDIDRFGFIQERRSWNQIIKLISMYDCLLRTFQRFCQRLANANWWSHAFTQLRWQGSVNIISGRRDPSYRGYTFPTLPDKKEKSSGLFNSYLKGLIILTPEDTEP